ncbi:MAG: WYL domain-containing protein [Acidobacteria bacterium]|nr:WYL domain-containing protein [Acidobacteriota bacterium]
MSKQASLSPPRRVHMHALARLLRICDEIRRGRYPNKRRLAEIVERDIRTVQRDLAELTNVYDAPIEFDRRQNGFHFTDPDWRFPAVAITEGELVAFFTAERMLRRIDAGTVEIRLAREAIRKLAALLPEEVVVDLAALGEAISFAPEPALDAAPEVLSRLAAAAARRETLRVLYYSQHRGAETEREIDVLKLHQWLGEWYAISRDHLSGGEVRDFHAGRIRKLEATGRTFEPPEGWNAEEHLKRGFGMFRGGEPVTVEIEFDAQQAPYARERQFHPTQQRRELEGGRVGLTFDVTEAALVQVARWLMQYGEHAIAITPPKLRRMMKRQLTAATALYADDDDENGE